MSVRIQENVALAPFTTFGIGGPARFFAEALSDSDALEALDFAATRDVPLFVLGGGSNLLVADEGFPGLVLKIGIQGVRFEPSGDRVLVQAAAGEDWDGLVAQAVERGLAGVECLSGVPGLVGGTPIQNVGAYGQSISSVLVSVSAFDRANWRMVELSHSDCQFGYRTSAFNTSQKERYLVLGATYELRPGAPAAIDYADLHRRFESRRDDPSLAEVRQAVREIRAGKSMLIVPGDPDCRSAGSFFKNPIVAEDVYQRVAASGLQSPPKYPASPGFVKIPAAWLIERAGIAKGFEMGPAAISRNHTLALVNRGGATAADIVRLAREVRRRVEDRFGIVLVPEPVFVGFSEPL